MLKRAFLATALCGWTALAAAETAYVTDSLRLGLHAASDTSGRPFENLISGAAVEVLERNTNYARVRLVDGREGWVKAMYLVTLKPAAARVAELEAEIATLKEAAAAAKTAQTAAEHELGRFTAELQAKTGSAETDPGHRAAPAGGERGSRGTARVLPPHAAAQMGDSRRRRSASGRFSGRACGGSTP